MSQRIGRKMGPSGVETVAASDDDIYNDLIEEDALSEDEPSARY